ncbi:MAG: N-acetylmuramoyl-L-alanine amidase [Oscillospiraceae bacterium]|nr:N-acetylmuramoyl-L-alanine amidase [Oscillospiraceae bacterium]
MIIFIRKRFVLPCIVLFLTTLTLISVLQAGESKAVSAQNLLNLSSTPVFVLDAGHGGADGGTSSASGVLESDINLAITLRMRDLFTLLGQSTVLTRRDENSLADDPSASIRQQKVSDTKNRVALVNSIENARLISIHQNALAGHPSVHGAQVFYNAVGDSSVLAETMQQDLNQTVNVGNEKGKKPISKDIYLMSHVTCPAVLVECGFLSNTAESEILQTPSYQMLLAMTICCAALKR